VDSSLSDDELTNADIISGQLRPRIFRNTIQQRPIPATEIAENELDLSENYDLLDPNVQKTGNVITLKYDSIDWLQQPFATTVENVNPFHVVEYIGEIKLSPNTDNWVRTIRIPPKTITRTVNRTSTISVWGRTGRQVRFWQNRGSSFTISGWAFGGFLLRRPFAQRTDGRATPRARFTTRTIQIPARIRNILNLLRNPRRSVSSRSQDVLLSSGIEKYIRSRNISFFGTGFRPLARHYQFFDSHSNVDFIPKLVEIANSATLENYGTNSGSFRTGETIQVYSSGKKIGTFRLASSNHKTGKFNAPTFTYTTNPYVTSENISSGYSQSSKTLNIDLNSLSAEAQGNFNGYLKKGAKIVGQTSGAVAYVKDLRLIADANGAEMVVFQTVSSAANALEVTNGAASGAVVIGTMGSDSNVGLNITPKGSGEVTVSSDMTIVDDKKLYFGTNQDTYLEYDEDGTDKLIIKGNTTFLDGAYDFDIASHDTSNGLKLGGTLVTATAAELNYVDGVTSNIQTQLNAKASTGKAIAMAMVFG